LFFDQRPKEVCVHMLTSPESLQAFIGMEEEDHAQVVGHLVPTYEPYWKIRA
jgi:hypothetical protein